MSKLQTVLSTRNEHSLPKRMDTSAPPNANYDILFSIFQPRSDQQKVRWDVRSAINSKEFTFIILFSFYFCMNEKENECTKDSLYQLV